MMMMTLIQMSRAEQQGLIKSVTAAPKKSKA